MDREKILDRFNPGLEKNQYVILIAVFVIGGLSGFFYYEINDQRIESTELDLEVNSSNSVATADFFNRSVDFFAEDGMNTTFYIDRDRDGSADDEIDIERDGEIHQATELIDYREGIYRLHYRYSDDPEEEDDGWLEIRRVEALK